MELTTISKSLRDRVQCLLLSNKRTKVKELATCFDVVPKTIYLWFDLWEKHGVSGILLKAGTGRKKKLRAIEVQTIKELVGESPQNLKPVLDILRETHGVDVSKKTLQRFLKTQRFDLAAGS